ncbi:hypothetical protein PG987_008211 [Apiospora arundinis]
MSSPGTTTAAPSLLGNWTPGRPGCLQQKDWWIWSYDGPKRDARTVLGGPSQTENCFPTAGAPTGTYAGSQCPPNYSAACTDRLIQNGAVTCCPTAYAFSCVPEPFTVSHLDWFRCISRHGTTGSPTIVMTDFVAKTSTTVQRKQFAHENLFAMAMVYQTPLPTSTLIPGATVSPSSGDSPAPLPSETGSNQPSPSSPPESQGLSGAASAGIGVGAGVGVLLLALVAFFLYRRRRRDSARGKSELPTTSGPTGAPAAAAAAAPPAMAQSSPPPPPFMPNQHTGGSVGYGEHGTGTGDSAYWDARAKHEMIGSTPSPEPAANTMIPDRHEMDCGDSRSELPSYRQ